MERRIFTCWSCSLHGEIVEKDSWHLPKVKCTYTKRAGKLSRGYNCNHFKYKQIHKDVVDDGLPIKNK